MFKLHHSDVRGTAAAVSIKMAKGVEYEAGLALTTAGEIAKGTVKPDYICLKKDKGFEGGTIAAYRILPQYTLATKLTASGAKLKVGDKVTLSEDGRGVTATTKDGVAEIVRIDGTAIGDTVLVKF